MGIRTFIKHLFHKYQMFNYVNKFDRRSKCRTHHTRLSATELATVKSFYKPFIKIRPYAHAFYKEKTGLFAVNYIPDSIHIAYIDPYFNDWTLAKHIDNKCYYPRLFSGLNMPEMIAYRINDFWYDNNNAIVSEENVISYINSCKYECFIKKANDSYGGKGVYYYDGGGNNTSNDLKSIFSIIKGDLVIQKRLEQSEIMSKLHKDSVNSIRHISLLSREGDVTILSSILRMGVGGAKVDNASSGGITVGINPNGQLKSVAYSSLGEKYYEHPSSSVPFDDVTIPNYDSTLELVIKTHPKFPHFRLISWDIAMDINNEPVLIEANLCDGELDFHQLNNGPLFKDKTKAILSEVFGNN